jgi:hypothetical protein
VFRSNADVAHVVGLLLIEAERVAARFGVLFVKAYISLQGAARPRCRAFALFGMVVTSDPASRGWPAWRLPVILFALTPSCVRYTSAFIRAEASADSLVRRMLFTSTRSCAQTLSRWPFDSTKLRARKLNLVNSFNAGSVVQPFDQRYLISVFPKFMVSSSHPASSKGRTRRHER